MSPILFDIFINDIYGEPGQLRFNLGVSIPGVPMLIEGRLSGLLFADDLVGVSETTMGVEKQAERISEWCETWEMGVGIKKCGVMCIGWGTEIAIELANAEQEQMTMHPPTINGLQVPVVTEYTYLGVVVTRDLDFDAMVNGRCKRAEKAMCMILPLLRAQSVPLGLRVSVLRTVVLSTLLYGSEIWGMDDCRCSKAQLIVNEALRAIMGCKRLDMTQPVAAMWRELGVPPICAMAAARRARAIRKFPGLKTWIGTLGQYEHRSMRRAWMAQSRVWLKKYCPDVQYRSDGETGQYDTECEDQRVETSVLGVRWTAYERTKKWEASGPYLDSGFAETAWASLKQIPMSSRSEQVRLGQGLRMLSLCRTKGLWTARKRAKRGAIAKKYLGICPCCSIKGGEGETVEHLLMECQRWDDERERCMGDILRRIEAMGPMEQGDRVVLLLGGESGGCRIASWLPSSTAPEAITCGAFQVARFLKSIRSDRAAILSQIRHKELGIE
jgi:hypothetical protein